MIEGGEMVNIGPDPEEWGTRVGPEVDDLDLRILAELQEDGRRSYREMSQRLGVSPGTVRSRLLQLIEEGVVQ
ncbi:MAG TPA: winged helix-turn-helix transcriptional regulator, partial [Actinomycetota bacterium]|nr:winged helix-turn-helix transcriptional regulator [Actinomycetota bacterium]